MLSAKKRGKLREELRVYRCYSRPRICRGVRRVKGSAGGGGRSVREIPVRLVRAGRPTLNLMLYCSIQGLVGGGRALSLADIQKIKWETGPRRVATAIASTPQIHWEIVTGLSPAC